MKHPRVNLIFAVAAVLCALTLGLGGAATAQVDKDARRVPSRLLNLPKMPVTLDRVSATGVGRETVLTYSITNRARGRISDVEVAFFVVDSTGHIKGGGGWEREVDVAPNATEEFPVILQSRVDAGDRLFVAVVRAAGRAGTFEAGNEELLKAVEAQAGGRK